MQIVTMPNLNSDPCANATARHWRGPPPLIVGYGDVPPQHSTKELEKQNVHS